MTKQRIDPRYKDLELVKEKVELAYKFKFPKSNCPFSFKFQLAKEIIVTKKTNKNYTLKQAIEICFKKYEYKQQPTKIDLKKFFVLRVMIEQKFVDNKKS